MNATAPHLGSSLDDFLKEEGIFEQTQNRAIKEVIDSKLDYSESHSLLADLI